MNQKPLPSTEEIAHHLTKKLIEGLPSIIDDIKHNGQYILAIGAATHVNILIPTTIKTRDMEEMCKSFLMGWIATEVDSMINPKS